MFKDSAKLAYNFTVAFVVMFTATAAAQIVGSKIVNKITFK